MSEGKPEPQGLVWSGAGASGEACALPDTRDRGALETPAGPPTTVSGFFSTGKALCFLSCQNLDGASEDHWPLGEPEAKIRGMSLDRQGCVQRPLSPLKQGDRLKSYSKARAITHFP